MITTACTLLSLLQLIERFKLLELKQRKLMLLALGSNDYNTRISGKLWIKHVFSMNFTHFLEIVLHQCVSHCNQPIGPKYAYTTKIRMDRVLVAN